MTCVADIGEIYNQIIWLSLPAILQWTIINTTRDIKDIICHAENISRSDTRKILPPKNTAEKNNIKRQAKWFNCQPKSFGICNSARAMD